MMDMIFISVFHQSYCGVEYLSINLTQENQVSGHFSSMGKNTNHWSALHESINIILLISHSHVICMRDFRLKQKFTYIKRQQVMIKLQLENEFFIKFWVFQKWINLQ
jgi:hypothetical protein